MSNNDIDIKDVLSKRIYELRKERGESQERFANVVGVSTDTISKAEQINERAPSAETIFKIATACNVSIDWLFGKDGKYTDRASDILLVLDKFLNFKIVSKGYANKNGFIDYPFFTVSIDENLDRFLRNLYKAEQSKKEEGWDDELFNQRVNAITESFNRVLSNGLESKKITYTLIPSGEDNENEHAVNAIMELLGYEKLYELTQEPIKEIDGFDSLRLEQDGNGNFRYVIVDE